MLLNDMANVLRDGGSVVEEVAGWVGWNHGALTQVDCIVIHHTATPATAVGDYPSLNIVRNGRSDLAGPLAQLGAGRSGKIYVISNGVAWHAGATLQAWMDNYHAIGIEVESPGTGVQWPDAQVQSVARAVASLCKEYDVPVSRVLGHKEICYPVGRKIDPVGIPGDMPAFRALVQQYLNSAFAVHPKKNYPEDFMYILNNGPQGKRYAILSGPVFVGLGSTGEKQDADRAIAAGAPYQWVENFTWDDFDQRSKALSNYNLNGLPVRVVGEVDANVTNDSINTVDVTPSA